MFLPAPTFIDPMAAFNAALAISPIAPSGSLVLAAVPVPQQVGFQAALRPASRSPRCRVPSGNVQMAANGIEDALNRHGVCLSANCSGFRPGQHGILQISPLISGHAGPGPLGRAVDRLRGEGGGREAKEQGGLNLFKWGSNTTTKPGGWKEGDFMLSLPNRGSPHANWI